MWSVSVTPKRSLEPPAATGACRVLSRRPCGWNQAARGLWVWPLCLAQRPAPAPTPWHAPQSAPLCGRAACRCVRTTAWVSPHRLDSWGFPGLRAVSKAVLDIRNRFSFLLDKNLGAWLVRHVHSHHLAAVILSCSIYLGPFCGCGELRSCGLNLHFPEDQPC